MSYNASLKDLRLPLHGYIALLMIAISWVLNWSMEGLRTHFLFFPLWLGYSLFVDALVKKRKGHSLLSRDPLKYIFLFFISIPVWWFFELINLRTQNWLYLGREYFTGFEYFLYASMNFSTVIPAVFGTAELMGSFKWVKNLGKGPRIPAHKSGLTLLMVLGILMLIVLMIWPSWFYVFVWLSVFLIIDVINHMSGRRSLVYYSDQRNWKPMVSLALGCLLCGFFWEMWNYYSYPKWMYSTPGVEFLYIFEMPFLGYLGYIPFSFELFAFYHLITNSRREEGNNYYLQL